MKKYLSVLIAFLIIFPMVSQPSFAEGGKEAVSSLLLPTTGQAMNGELGTGKTKLMAGIEVAAITAVTLIGLAGGGAIVWAGAGPLVANHIWSATDAYKSARLRQDPLNQQQMADAQRSLETSRENRFEREQSYRSNIRDRIQRAGEQAS